MPLYPYRCTQCGHRFEKIQSFSDEPETSCPRCGGALERQLTAPGLQFKGAGWYVNDYAAKSSAPAGESSASETKTSGAEKAPPAEKSTPSAAESPAPAAKPDAAKS